MAIDDTPEKDIHTSGPSDSSAKFVAIFVILAALVVGEIFALSKISSVRSSLETQQSQLRKDLTAQLQEQLSSSISDIQKSNAQQMESMKTEIDSAATKMGSTTRQLRTTKVALTKLEKAQQEQSNQLQQQISQKADSQQLTAVSQDVSNTKTDLDTTKKNLETVRTDLGMARSELGTLIARNHDDIETLRKLGERDYFEFNLERNKPERVANVGLTLKKADVKRHKFNLVLTVDDVSVEKKNRNSSEPIFFYVKGQKKPYEVVVNGITSRSVKGYVSTPKGATEVAATSTGGR